jgi:hypothetical protein
MKISIFIALALLAGFISTSALDTQKRLKKIEAQQTAALEQINDHIGKLASLINETNFEAQEATAMASNNNQHIRKLAPVLSNIDAATADNLIQMQRIEKAIQENQRATRQAALSITPPRTTPPVTPSFTAKRIDIMEGHEQRMRDKEQSDATGALQGIHNELMWKKAKDAIK